MTKLLMIIKLIKLFFSHYIKSRLISRNKIWVLSRTACLFNDTYKLMKLDHIPRYNIQKGRVDFWLDIFTFNNKKPNLKDIFFVKRFDIKGLFMEQYHFNLKFKNEPYMFVMDSYSELVDRNYYSKCNDNSFFACSEDVDEDQLNSKGLIKNEDLVKLYNNFFSKFRDIYPTCPIIFILVPSKLEKREFYIQRSEIIKKTIYDISNKLDNFYVVEIPEYLIYNNINDNFPYHYSDNVYTYLSNYFYSKNLFSNLKII